MGSALSQDGSAAAADARLPQQEAPFYLRAAERVLRDTFRAAGLANVVSVQTQHTTERLRLVEELLVRSPAVAEVLLGDDDEDEGSD